MSILSERFARSVVVVAVIVAARSYTHGWTIRCSSQRHRVAGDPIPARAHRWRWHSVQRRHSTTRPQHHMLGDLDQTRVPCRVRRRRNKSSDDGVLYSLVSRRRSAAEKAIEEWGSGGTESRTMSSRRTPWRRRDRPQLHMETAEVTVHAGEVPIDSNELNQALGENNDVEARRAPCTEAETRERTCQEEERVDHSVDSIDNLRLDVSGATGDNPQSEETPCAGTADNADRRFMRMALRLAERAREEGEVPIGAVVAETVEDIYGRKRVLATGRNDVERKKDASAHAEMLCLQAAAKVRDSWRLTGSTLYVTVEPCVMCLSAAQLFRVDRVVYGAPNPNLGACGGWVDLPSYKHAFHDLDVRGGVLSEQSASLLQEFFRSRRRESTNALLPAIGLLPPRRDYVENDVMALPDKSSAEEVQTPR